MQSHGVRNFRRAVFAGVPLFLLLFTVLLSTSFFKSSSLSAQGSASSVTGIVRFEDRTPVAGVEIRAVPSAAVSWLPLVGGEDRAEEGAMPELAAGGDDPLVTVTAEDGTFGLELIPGRYTLELSHSQHVLEPNEVVIYAYSGLFVSIVVKGASAPTPTPGMSDLALGADSSCMRRPTGSVECWGLNDAGQLGDGTFNARATPAPVIALEGGVESISAGYAHVCALTTMGGVKCWGQNVNYEAGVREPAFITTPVDIPGLTLGVRTFTAGYYHTCAIQNYGGVVCWGNGTDGQLGNSDYKSSYIPVDVTGLISGVQALAAGSHHTCALTEAGGVKCWGADSHGQLGNDEALESQSSPVDVEGLTSGVVAIGASGSQSCAVVSGGAVKCWGQYQEGEFGAAASIAEPVPVDSITLTSDIVAITGGHLFNCALTSAGGVKCWGENEHGQLGDGSQESRYIPEWVTGLDSGVAEIDAGTQHTCVRMTSGAVKCWGTNSFGQIGPGEATVTTPQDVVGFP